MRLTLPKDALAPQQRLEPQSLGTGLRLHQVYNEIARDREKTTEQL